MSKTEDQLERPIFKHAVYFKRNFKPPGTFIKSVFLNDLKYDSRNYLINRIKRIYHKSKAYDLFIKVELFFFFYPNEEHYSWSFYRNLLACLHFPDAFFSHHLNKLKFRFNREIEKIPYDIIEKGFKVSIYRQSNLISLEEASFRSTLRSGIGFETLPPRLFYRLNVRYDSKFLMKACESDSTDCD